MTERPILFSAPMVRAILEGRKSQTRRLANRRAAIVHPGDRLWVRESWRAAEAHDRLPPRDIERESAVVYYEADQLKSAWELGKLRPGIHMPRWASRLTLEVEAVRIEPLQAISEADAIAEGVHLIAAWNTEGPNFYMIKTSAIGSINQPTARETFSLFWQHLNGEESWAANPEVVVITFRRVPA